MGWCSEGKHEHTGIVGCHPIDRHHREFSHRSVGAGAGPGKDEYTWPEPKEAHEDEEGDIYSGGRSGESIWSNSFGIEPLVGR